MRRLYETRHIPAARRLAAWLLAAVFSLSLCAQSAWAAPAASAERTVIPLGKAVGIKLFAAGVLVVGLADGDTPARTCGLRQGDIITAMDGTAIDSTEQVQSLLAEAAGQETTLTVRRGSSTLALSACARPSAGGAWQLGAWIRDSMAGIGTLTYYDPATGQYGALGHGITDVDTAQLMPFADGSILPSTVKAVKKGTAGSAGELKGDFDLTADLGDLYANTNCGVFGTLDAADHAAVLGEAVPTGTAKAGPAVIRANVRGDTVEEYAIEILKVIPNASDGREMVISVTDPELIAVTGGIVQGMSGSPILQEGKLVGAVTHVLLNDPCKGYGISMETMLRAA